jgi:hypothetical protein
MKLKQTTRKASKIKLALTGTSGSGKSMSSLLLAKGLCNGDLSKVAVIDTENAIDLYSHIGNFNVLNLSQPFSPNRYIEAIELCEKSGIEVIVIDSISHCWNYLLQLHGSMQGNSFTNWNKVTPLHNVFVQKILQSPVHIICTIRTKQDYLMETKDGKTTISKVGTKPIQRNEIEYEFTTVLNITAEHKAKATKDRTGLFNGGLDFFITEATGSALREWCCSTLTLDDVKKQIKDCITIEQLTTLHHQYPQFYQLLTNDFVQQKQQLQENPIINNNLKLNHHGNNPIQTNK